MQKDVHQIWQEFHKELKGFILNKTRDENDAEDVLQESFLKIIQNIDKINASDNMRAYLFTMVRNTLYDFFKKKSIVLEHQDSHEVFNEEETESLNDSIAQCCIKPLIHQLPQAYKEALLITEFQNISQKGLAQQLNISYSGAKSRVQRAKEKLKNLILQCCNFEYDAYGNFLEQKSKNCNCN